MTEPLPISPREVVAKRKPLKFRYALLLSYLLFISGDIVDETIRWTSHLGGFVNGVFNALFVFTLPWLLVCLTWAFVVRALYNSQPWNRFRTFWIVAPALAVFLLSIANIVQHPSTPTARFERYSKTKLPADAQGLHYSFSGGGFADYGDSYYFQTSPAEVDRLIKEMKLELDSLFLDEEARKMRSGQVPLLPDCPDHRQWKGASLWMRMEEGWFYHLLHSADKTQIYIYIGCI